MSDFTEFKFWQFMMVYMLGNRMVVYVCFTFFYKYFIKVFIKKKEESKKAFSTL